MKAWHFVGDTLRDGRPIPPDGEWLEHEGELVLCENGLHASERILDALRYAPGSMICKVKLAEEIVRDKNKMVARKRKILWRIDGELVLRAFARWCAVQIIHQWDAPNVVIEYLKTGNDDTRIAANVAAVVARMKGVRGGGAVRAVAWATTLDTILYLDRAVVGAAEKAAYEKQLITMIEEARNGKTEWTFEIPESEE